MIKRLGFVGLGVMGAPMAAHLLRLGGTVTVWNRTTAKADGLVANGAIRAVNLQELAATSDVVFLCVSRTEDVRECLAELLRTAKPGTLFVDHSTIEPAAAVQVAQDLKSKQLRFVDAPITGGSMGAQRGQLTIFLGGEEEDVSEAIQHAKPYTKFAERVGSSGAGQMAKMANQIAVGGALLGLCESLSFAQKAGLNLVQIRGLIARGAAGSWAFENYGPKILARDWTPGFSISNQRKDFAYCASAAHAIGAAIPGTHLVDSLLAVLDAQGHGDWTTAALYEQLLASGGEPAPADTSGEAS